MDLSNQYITEFSRFDFPINDWVIMGGTVLSIHGIRESQDLDIMVSPELYKTIKEREEFKEELAMTMDDIYSIGLDMTLDNMSQALSRMVLKLPGFKIEIFNDMWPLSLTFDEVLLRSKIVKDMKNEDLANIVDLELIKEWKTKLARPKDVLDVEKINNFLRD